LRKLSISRYKTVIAASALALLMMAASLSGCGKVLSPTVPTLGTIAPQSTTTAGTSATTAPSATAPLTTTAATTISPSALLERWPAASTLPALYTPNHADAASAAPLKGMTVLLDAGHGGKDPGAVAGGVNEKSINLPIALKTRALLQAMGANVVMFRTEDVYLPIYNRIAQTGLHILGRAAGLNGFAAQFPAPHDLTFFQNDLNSIVSANSGDADGIMTGRGIHLGYGVQDDVRHLMDLERQFTDTILVSIHANSTLPATEPRGLEVYYAPTEVIYNDEVSGIQQDRDVTHYGYPVYKAYTFYDDAARARLANAVFSGVAALMPALGTASHASIQQGNYGILREQNLASISVETGFLSNADDRAILLDQGNQDRIAQGIANGILAYFTTAGG